MGVDPFPFTATGSSAIQPEFQEHDKVLDFSTGISFVVVVVVVVAGSMKV